MFNDNAVKKGQEKYGKLKNSYELEKKFESLLQRAGIQCDVGISGSSISVGVDTESDVNKVKGLISKMPDDYQFVSLQKMDGYFVVNIKVKK